MIVDLEDGDLDDGEDGDQDDDDDDDEEEEEDTHHGDEGFNKAGQKGNSSFIGQAHLVIINDNLSIIICQHYRHETFNRNGEGDDEAYGVTQNIQNIAMAAMAMTMMAMVMLTERPDEA